MVFSGVSNLILTAYIWIFVGEKRITRNENLSGKKLYQLTKKMIFGENWVKFFKYAVLSETALVLIRDSIQLKLIQNGIERAEIATMESVTVIFKFIFCMFTYLIIKENQNLKRYHFSKVYNMLLTIYFFYIFLHFKQTKNHRLAMDEIFSFFCLRVFSVAQDVYVFAFFNNKIDEEMGATGITLLLCIGNAINIIPKTIGYKIIGIIQNYESYAINCFVLAIIGYIVTWYYAVELDSYTADK